MPKRPQGQQRPADMNACAVMVARIAAGEIEDTGSSAAERRKSEWAGGKPRAEKLGTEERRKIAKEAAAASWK